MKTTKRPPRKLSEEQKRKMRARAKEQYKRRKALMEAVKAFLPKVAK